MQTREDFAIKLPKEQFIWRLLPVSRLNSRVLVCFLRRFLSDGPKPATPAHNSAKHFESTHSTSRLLIFWINCPWQRMTSSPCDGDRRRASSETDEEAWLKCCGDGVILPSISLIGWIAA